MTFDDLNEVEPEERIHFLRCQECGRWFDMRSLDDTFFHEDHIERPDIPSDGPGVRIN